MVMVELRVVLPVKIRYNTAGNAYGQAKYVDKDEELVLHQTTKGDQ